MSSALDYVLEMPQACQEGNINILIKQTQRQNKIRNLDK